MLFVAPSARAAATCGGAAAERRRAGAKVDLRDRRRHRRRRSASGRVDLDPEGPLRLEGQVLDRGRRRRRRRDRVASSRAAAHRRRREDDGTFVVRQARRPRRTTLTATSGELVGGPVDVQADREQRSGRDPARRGREARRHGHRRRQAADRRRRRQARRRRRAQRARPTTNGTATLTPVRPGWVAVEVERDRLRAGDVVHARSARRARPATLTVTLHKGFAVIGPRHRRGRQADREGAGHRRATACCGRSAAAATGRRPTTRASSRSPRSRPAATCCRRSTASTRRRESPPVTVARRAGHRHRDHDEGGRRRSRHGRRHATASRVPYATVRVARRGRSAMGDGAVAPGDDRQGKGAFELRGPARAASSRRAPSPTPRRASSSTSISRPKPAKRDLKLVLDVSRHDRRRRRRRDRPAGPRGPGQRVPRLPRRRVDRGLALAGMSSATTDGAGEFAIHGLPDGAYRLWAARARAAAMRGWGQQGTPAKTGDKNVKHHAAGARRARRQDRARRRRGAEARERPARLSAGDAGRRDGAFTLKDARRPAATTSRSAAPSSRELIEARRRSRARQDDRPRHDHRDARPQAHRQGRRRERHAGRRARRSRSARCCSRWQGADDQLGRTSRRWRGIAHRRRPIRTATSRSSASAEGDDTSMAEHPDTRPLDRRSQVPEGTDDPPPITLALRGFGSITGKVTQKGEPQARRHDHRHDEGRRRAGRDRADRRRRHVHAAEGRRGHARAQRDAAEGLMSLKSTSATVQVTAGKQTHGRRSTSRSARSRSPSTVKPLPGNKVDAAQVFLFARHRRGARTRSSSPTASLPGGVARA